jgi:DNA-directed RNA polymerase subunit F
MEKIDKLYEQLENFQYVQAKMRDEGFDYCLRHYSSFEEVEDEKFHSLRESYIKIADELEEYVKSKINQIQDEIQEEQ